MEEEIGNGVGEEGAGEDHFGKLLADESKCKPYARANKYANMGSDK